MSQQNQHLENDRGKAVRIRKLEIQRFRGIDKLTLYPSERTVILGPNNSCKSTVLEALDLLLHWTRGRPRPGPLEVDYFNRGVEAEFEIEAVLGDLPTGLRADAHAHLEGWVSGVREVVPQPDGGDIEPCLRIRVRGTPDQEHAHEYAKLESEGARITGKIRAQFGWVYDGRSRDPAWQLQFYQGGLLDRLFSEIDPGPGLQNLRDALTEGAALVNQDKAVSGILAELGGDLAALGLGFGNRNPLFEAGPVTSRELLQTLRLAMPDAEGFSIPIGRQGRGVQRLLLVSVLLRLARVSHRPVIAGFEEPEEALEPIRQAQIAAMIEAIPQSGGQIFVVTHSPEVVRAFHVDDLILLARSDQSVIARPLGEAVTPAVRQAYERRLDGPVVRGLFAPLPLVVEGPSDRAIFDVFWQALAATGATKPVHQVGIDVVAADGASMMPMLAEVLSAAGKTVLAWCEQDNESVRKHVQRLREGGHCAAILLFNAAEPKLELALAGAAKIDSLVAGLSAIAEDREYDWDAQKAELIAKSSGLTYETRTSIAQANSLREIAQTVAPAEFRKLVGIVLAADKVTPFEMKSYRPARLLAESIVACEGVPASFKDGLKDLADWLVGARPRPSEFTMPAS